MLAIASQKSQDGDKGKYYESSLCNDAANPAAISHNRGLKVTADPDMLQ